MTAPIPEREILRFHALAYAELNVTDYSLSRRVAARFVNGDFEIAETDRAKAPQTCRQLESIRARIRIREEDA